MSNPILDIVYLPLHIVNRSHYRYNTDDSVLFNKELYWLFYKAYYNTPIYKWYNNNKSMVNAISYTMGDE